MKAYQVFVPVKIVINDIEVLEQQGLSYAIYPRREEAEALARELRNHPVTSGASARAVDIRSALVMPIDEVLTKYICQGCGEEYDSNGPEDANVIERRAGGRCLSCDPYYNDTPLAHQLDDNPVEGIDY